MASVCSPSCEKDVKVPVVRATYVNLYKWPESDAEFIRSVSAGRHPRVVDSVSCRQLYLRSYTFSREDSDDEDNRKEEETTGKVKSQCAAAGRRRLCWRRKSKSLRFRKAVVSFFRRLLSCTATVDVVVDY
ncbi:unnamed protein product [Cuscuta epithymum]|uniref:Uncharacterized protein n=1 Tax=Cuscuta epithymum TaxID=186058 RepID=A0AAV0CAX0_9ASTE|nr:unnamed protein product [Cuscuta epithymum]